MSDTAKMEIKPRTLRALACDIEDCHNPQSWADYCRAAAAMLETQAARIAELEAQNDTLRHATDKLRFALEKLNEKHQPLTLAFLTAVELLNDAALEGKKDEA